jgi:hypothetical protein
LSIKVDIKLPSGSVVLTFKFLPAVEVAVVDVKLKVDKDSQIFSADKEVIFNSFFKIIIYFACHFHSGKWQLPFNRGEKRCYFGGS